MKSKLAQRCLTPLLVVVVLGGLCVAAAYSVMLRHGVAVSLTGGDIALLLACPVLLVVVGVVAAIRLAGELSERAARLTSAATRLADGAVDLGDRLGEGDDELAEIGRALNKTASSLAARVQQFQEITQGNLSTEIGLASRDDPLGRAIGEMVDYLRSTVAALEQVAEGNLDSDVKARGAKDEFGAAIERMIAEIRARASQLQEIAEGNLTTEVSVNSDRDQMGMALQKTVQSLRDVAAVATEIAAGNLSVPFESRSDKDVLGAAFARMLRDLSTLVLQLQSAADQIASSSAEISTSADEHEKAMHQQTAAVNETTSTVSELTANQQQLAGKADDLNALLAAVQSSIDAGNAEVQSAVGSLDEVRTRATGTAEHVAELSERVQQIGKIITTVREITEQINLLALNAAIEAARAGEQGRGFAVVANEVRKLAERTDRSTNEIVDLVQEIQTATAATVSANDQSMASIQDGANSVEEMSAAFAQIHDNVQSLVDGVEQMILAIRQQQAAFTEIDSSMREINVGMEQTVAGTQQNVAASRELTTTAEMLREQVRTFKLPSSVSPGRGEDESSLRLVNDRPAVKRDAGETAQS